MTIMVESSRTFLFTEYALKGCGTLQERGTDPNVWDKLPVRGFPNLAA
jgi:homogentisate 1,2-dioxygenase